MVHTRASGTKVSRRTETFCTKSQAERFLPIRYPLRRREYYVTNSEELLKLAEGQSGFLHPSPVRIPNVWGRDNSCQAVRVPHKTECRRPDNHRLRDEYRKSHRSTGERLAGRAAKSSSCPRPKRRKTQTPGHCDGAGCVQKKSALLLPRLSARENL